jgi:hypothetical protein
MQIKIIFCMLLVRRGTADAASLGVLHCPAGNQPLRNFKGTEPFFGREAIVI